MYSKPDVGERKYMVDGAVYTIQQASFPIHPRSRE